MAPPLIRRAKPDDSDAILAIEDQSFASPNWSAAAFAHYSTMVAEVDCEVGGVLVTRETYSGDGDSPAEIEILNLAVLPHLRRSGLASLLLSWLLRQRATLFLEVRESNQPAQALYRKFGFIEIGRRPSYYDNPPECALVMQMKKC